MVAAMSDFDPNQEINPNIPIGMTIVLLGLGVATVYMIVMVL
jgi:hypothetical protein